jgi:hypothetical protein
MPGLACVPSFHAGPVLPLRRRPDVLGDGKVPGIVLGRLYVWRRAVVETAQTRYDSLSIKKVSGAAMKIRKFQTDPRPPTPRSHR